MGSVPQFIQDNNKGTNIFRTQNYLATSRVNWSGNPEGILIYNRGTMPTQRTYVFSASVMSTVDCNFAWIAGSFPIEPPGLAGFALDTPYNISRLGHDPSISNAWPGYTRSAMDAVSGWMGVGLNVDVETMPQFCTGVAPTRTQLMPDGQYFEVLPGRFVGLTSVVSGAAGQLLEIIIDFIEI